MIAEWQLGQDVTAGDRSARLVDGAAANAAVTGSLRVEILDREGRVIEPFSAANAVPVTGDSTRMLVQWKSQTSLRDLAGETVRLEILG